LISEPALIEEAMLLNEELHIDKELCFTFL
jgi:hypothetical protein